MDVQVADVLRDDARRGHRGRWRGAASQCGARDGGAQHGKLIFPFRARWKVNIKDREGHMRAA